MYVVYGMAAFIALLLLLSSAFIMALAILRFAKIREDKVSECTIPPLID